MADQNLTSWKHRLDLIAHSVRVRDVAKPLSRFEGDDDADGAWEELMQSDHEFGVVYQGPILLGYVVVYEFPEIMAGVPLREIVSPVPADLLVEESSPLLNIIPAFQHRFFYFGLCDNTVNSVVSWQEVDSNLGRIVAMALIMEFELALDDGLRFRSREIIETLSEGRRKKAEALLEHKIGHLDRPSAWRKPSLYSCLTLADKSTAARKLLAAEGDSSWQYSASMRKTFGLIEVVRNDIAHGNGLLLKLPLPVDIAGFFDSLQYATEWLRKQ